jgi:hypothetical protein
MDCRNFMVVTRHLIDYFNPSKFLFYRPLPHVKINTEKHQCSLYKGRPTFRQLFTRIQITSTRMFDSIQNSELHRAMQIGIVPS